MSLSAGSRSVRKHVHVIVHTAIFQRLAAKYRGICAVLPTTTLPTVPRLFHSFEAGGQMNHGEVKAPFVE